MPPIPTISTYPMPAAETIPPGPLHWPCRAERAALLIHDMQQYFVDFFPASAPPVDELIDNVERLAGTARATGIPVIYTAQPGAMTKVQRGLLADVWGPGMGGGTQERRIITRLTPAATDIVITKWRYSAFSRSPLADMMADQGRDQLIICGVYAHVGCLMTACDAFSRDIQPFLVADAVADFDAEHHHWALRYAAEQCARTLSTDAVIAQVTGVGSPVA
jgi:isochorismate hydrolase